jgi:hypothetical protein
MTRASYSQLTKEGLINIIRDAPHDNLESETKLVFSKRSGEE